VKGLADAGFLVAFANRNDRFHAWAIRVARDVTDPLLTCDAVLAEAAFHLQDNSLVLALVSEGLVAPAFEVSAELPHLQALAKRFANRRPDLADLCLIRMSELHPAHQVVTTDARDFRVYRRNKREVIPLLLPPGV
jgi:predicted nucleic acid-binding protein